MGNYLNPDVIKFTEAVDSDIYVDKTGLLEYANSVLCTSQKYICISRPRRFGKSITANMLALIKKSVLWDLLDKYPDFRYFDDTNLMRTMQDIYSKI